MNLVPKFYEWAFSTVPEKAMQKYPPMVMRGITFYCPSYAFPLIERTINCIEALDRDAFSLIVSHIHIVYDYQIGVSIGFVAGSVVINCEGFSHPWWSDNRIIWEDLGASLLRNAILCEVYKTDRKIVLAPWSKFKKEAAAKGLALRDKMRIYSPHDEIS